MNRPPRLPDCLIVGMMKSGTSSLYRWLAEQPECAPAVAKEPDFFSSDQAWRRWVAWYGEVFAHALATSWSAKPPPATPTPFKVAPWLHAG